MREKKYILSPCGTSLLTNQAKREEGNLGNLVYQYANLTKSEEIPEEDRKRLNNLIDKVRETLQSADNQKVMEMSAELNGILQIYGGKIDHSNEGDYHFLLSTDTWLGEETAKLVKSWLESKGLTAVVHRQQDLQTQEILTFQSSLSDLIKKLSEEIPAFSNQGYTIIFNLTGGFKSVQGFLQSIANFYADETVYIFETSPELLRIPKLPVRMDPIPILEEKISTFRRLALNLQVSSDSLEGIPETLLLTIDDQTTLSPWGELIWNQSKKEIYSGQLFPPPTDKIQYTSKFEKTVSNLSENRILQINVRMDELALYLEKGQNLRSLRFQQLKGNPMPPSTHEIYAWSDKDARRIFGYFEGDIFVLDKLDRGLH